MRKLLQRTDRGMLAYASIVIGSLLAGVLVIVPTGQAKSRDEGSCDTCVSVPRDSPAPAAAHRLMQAPGVNRRGVSQDAVAVRQDCLATQESSPFAM